MVVNIEELTETCFANDEPVLYHLKCNEDILIEPIKVKDWQKFANCLNILLMEKDECGSAEIIRMTYLEYLILLSSKYSDLLDKLGVILRYSLNAKYMQIGEYLGKTAIGIYDKEEILKYMITSKEFDDIKKIILFQNIYDYDDRYVSPDVKELYQEYIKAMSNGSSQVEPTMERKKIYVISKTGIKMSELNDMSYRIFSQLYMSSVNTDLYFARKLIQASEKYEVKEDVMYPLFEKEKDKYDGLFLSKDAVSNKLGKIQ